MKDELMALTKKIKSTEEELERLKKQLNPNSTEYVFSSAVLVKRLLELKEQKRELESTSEQNKEIAELVPDMPTADLIDNLPAESEPAAMEGEKLRLILSGKEIGKGTISIRILSSVLHSLQAITDHLAYAVQNGPVQTGYIPEHILRQSDLRIKHTFPGSFGLEIEAATHAGSGKSEPLLTQSFEQLFDLLGSSHDSDTLLEQVAPLGPRTLRLFREWMSYMAEHEIGLACEWERPYGEPYHFAAGKDDFSTILKSVNSIRLDKTEEVEAIGSFIGVNLRQNSFELVEAESNRIISGKSRHDLLIKNKGLIGDVAKLRLASCTAENVITGKSQILWYLMDMKPWTTG